MDAANMAFPQVTRSTEHNSDLSMTQQTSPTSPEFDGISSTYTLNTPLQSSLIVKFPFSQDMAALAKNNLVHKGNDLCRVNVSSLDPEVAQVGAQQHHQKAFGAVNISPSHIEIDLPSAQQHNPKYLHLLTSPKVQLNSHSNARGPQQGAPLMQIDNRHIIRPGMLNMIPNTLSPSTDYGYGMETPVLNSPLEVTLQKGTTSFVSYAQNTFLPDDTTLNTGLLPRNDYNLSAEYLSSPTGHHHRLNQISQQTSLPTIDDHSGRIQYASPSTRNDYGPVEQGSMIASEAKSINDLPIVRNHTSQSMAISSSSLRRIIGITTITRDNADQRSLPKAGEDLTRLVEEAKGRKEIPKYHNTAVVRFVDGRWMVPQACTSCQDSKKAPKCDRRIPCNVCKNRSIDCSSNNLMVIIKAGRNPISALGHLDIAGPKRKRGKNTFNFSASVEDKDDYDAASSDAIDQYPPNKMRKLMDDDDDDGDDGDFIPDQGKLSSNDPKKLIVQAKPKKSDNKIAYHVNVQQDKPEPTGKPKVWAHKRQQLCETLPYYKAYESAAYTCEGKLYAFLIDKEVGIRDQFTDQIIISRCGGGKTQDETGKMVQTKNQESSPTAIAFDRAMNEKFPIAVIAGQGNSASPSSLPYYYNVLDWFHVTDVWREKIDGMISFIARLEKINLSETSWWAPKGTILAQPNFDSPKADFGVCPTCQHSSKVIFSQGFTCLETQCRSYFMFPVPIEHAALEYSFAFLAERTKYTGEQPDAISPPIITLDDKDFGYERKYRTGIVCPKCNCCIRRLQWSYWICENSGCDFTHRLNLRPVSVADAIRQGRDENKDENKDENEDENEDEKKAHKSKTVLDDQIGVKDKSCGMYTLREYALPNENGISIGFVRHFKSNGLINQQPDGPNDLFMQMQTKDLGLKRNPSRHADKVKEISTSHWAFNYGAPYKYSVSTESKGFDEAPDVILKAIKRLTWAGEQTINNNYYEMFQPFNEVLVVGYFEKSYIGYHDDGEKELGPTVATLSLGADATMKFRPKLKSPVGSFRGADQSVGKGKRQKKVMLSIILNHGDIVIMHGRDIQKYYEHSVIPHGKLRYALTSRFIDPARMKDDKDRKYTALAGTMPLGSEKYSYDGDINAKAIFKESSVDHAIRLKNHFDALCVSGDLSPACGLALLEEMKKTLIEKSSQN